MNKSLEEINKMNSPKNTGVSIFEIKENKNHEIIVLNCGKHLN